MKTADHSSTSSASAISGAGMRRSDTLRVSGGFADSSDTRGSVTARCANNGAIESSASVRPSIRSKIFTLTADASEQEVVASCARGATDSDRQTFALAEALRYVLPDAPVPQRPVGPRAQRRCSGAPHEHRADAIPTRDPSRSAVRRVRAPRDGPAHRCFGPEYE